MREVIPDEVDHVGDVEEMLAYYHDITDDPGEIMLYAMDAAPDGFADICRDLGATWLIHGVVSTDDTREENLERIRDGPPT